MTITVPASDRAMVYLGADMVNSNSGFCYMSVAATGLVQNDTWSISKDGAVDWADDWIVVGAAPGPNTFTAKYRRERLATVRLAIEPYCSYR